MTRLRSGHGPKRPPAANARPYTGTHSFTVRHRPEPHRPHQPNGHGLSGWGEAPLVVVAVGCEPGSFLGGEPEWGVAVGDQGEGVGGYPDVPADDAFNEAEHAAGVAAGDQDG